LDREPEPRAASLRALQTNLPAHHLGEALGDGETQAGPAVLAGVRGVDLAEALKEPAGVLRLETGAGVGNLQLQHAERPAGGDVDAALMRELHRIGEQ